jgi:hypothetical protein
MMIYSAPAVFSRPGELPGLLTAGLAALETVDAPEWDVAGLRAAMAGMAAIEGELQLAEAESAAALTIGRRLNSPAIVTTALYAHALACSQSQPATALTALEEYFEIVRSGVGTQVLARCHALAAQLRAATGDLTGALDDLRLAIGTAHGTGDRPAMAFALSRTVFVLCSNDSTTAAVLSGAIDRGDLQRLFPVLQWERGWLQRVTDELRTELGDDRYQAAVDRGIALPYDDAVATAVDAIGALVDR